MPAVPRRAPAPSPEAVKQLARLLDRYRNAEAAHHQRHDELCRAVARIRDQEGVSARGLAAALGVGSSTVQHWTRQGRQLR